MSAADVTPEEIAELRTMPHDNHRLVRRLLDAIEAAWAREKALEDQLDERVRILREALVELCDSQLSSRDRESAIANGLSAIEATEEA